MAIWLALKQEKLHPHPTHPRYSHLFLFSTLIMWVCSAESVLYCWTEHLHCRNHCHLLCSSDVIRCTVRSPMVKEVLSVEVGGWKCCCSSISFPLMMKQAVGLELVAVTILYRETFCVFSMFIAPVKSPVRC
jgi:hypothetical protein